MTAPRKIVIFPSPPHVHPTTPVPRYGEEVPIDIELASIIAELWRRGISTWSCCQDEGETRDSPVELSRWQGWATILFADILEANSFAMLVLGGLSQCGDGDEAVFGSWRWELSEFVVPLDRAPVRVGIPRQQLPVLTEWVGAAPKALHLRTIDLRDPSTSKME